ncbi:hypothetical protein CP980_12780 [Streptomyces vinaceus]|uniref:Uncharacterized protein n=2 Tax=Streptomyces vinaceus TaxID=1960 RepID=A0A5J6JQI2_STRVI|nr:hypothetical protein CP980_12780 [Streptomyces vinaceus]
MTVFLCVNCGGSLTPNLTPLPAVPSAPDEEARDKESRRAPAPLPQGHYAIETEPWGAPYVPHPDQEKGGPAQPRGPWRSDEGVAMVSAGPRNNIVIHPEDAPDLRPLPDGEKSGGCCGPSGDRGLNRACPCGARVATLAADCFGPYELHLDAMRAYGYNPS